MYWDSDLFYIRDFRAVRIGNISGQQCESNSEDVYVNKVEGSKKKTILTLPVEVLGSFKDKWDFIKDYRTKNYSRFL